MASGELTGSKLEEEANPSSCMFMMTDDPDAGSYTDSTDTNETESMSPNNECNILMPS